MLLNIEFSKASCHMPSLLSVIRGVSSLLLLPLCLPAALLPGCDVHGLYLSGTVNPNKPFLL